MSSPHSWEESGLLHVWEELGSLGAILRLASVFINLIVRKQSQNAMETEVPYSLGPNMAL